jgi:hypothetical protein
MTNTTTNEPTTDSLEQKIFELTALTGKEFMKTKVLNDWTLAKDIMKLVRQDRQELIARVNQLQTYKMHEGSTDILVMREDVLNKLKDSETGE